MLDRPSPDAPFDPAAITRPDPKLLTYFIIVSLLSTVGILPITLAVSLPLYFKYRTLKYRFDEEGIAMSWGLFFRREVHLTYRRTQDIHLTRNLIQRWMDLATVSVQTASGSSSPEMKIEGRQVMAGAMNPIHSLYPFRQFPPCMNISTGIGPGGSRLGR